MFLRLTSVRDKRERGRFAGHTHLNLLSATTAGLTGHNRTARARLFYSQLMSLYR
jgi:hypothetical protein